MACKTKCHKDLENTSIGHQKRDTKSELWCSYIQNRWNTLKARKYWLAACEALWRISHFRHLWRHVRTFAHLFQWPPPSRSLRSTSIRLALKNKANRSLNCAFYRKCISIPVDRDAQWNKRTFHWFQAISSR